MNIQKRFNSRYPAFTLNELLVVIIIIGILTALALPRLLPLVTKAKATEARLGLNHIYTLQKTYYFEHARYADRLDALGLEAETTVDEGGSANYRLDVIEADAHFFEARATSVVDFDGDGSFNTWSINEKKELQEIQVD